MKGLPTEWIGNNEEKLSKTYTLIYEATAYCLCLPDCGLPYRVKSSVLFIFYRNMSNYSQNISIYKRVMKEYLNKHQQGITDFLSGNKRTMNWNRTRTGSKRRGWCWWWKRLKQWSPMWALQIYRRMKRSSSWRGRRDWCRQQCR